MGIGVLWAIGVTVAAGVGLAVAWEQVQLVEDVQSGLRQKPPEQMFPEAQLLFVVQEASHTPGAGVAVGAGVGEAVGAGVAVATGEAVGLAVGAGVGVGVGVGV